MQRNRGPGLRVCEERGCSLILRVRPTLPGALEAGGAENAARARISETQRRPRTGQRPGASRRPALRKQRPLAAATTVDATNAATKANGSALGAREVTSRQAPGPNHGARGRGTAARGNPVALGTVVYEDSRMVRLKAPYVSGFLAFREVPFLVKLVQWLQEKEPDFMPQVLLVDGNGVLHQRDLPCIGVAKKLLQVDGLENNSVHKEKALKSHDHSTKPLYVSVGHRISLEVAVRLTHCCCRFRIPEPIRQADIRSREYIRRTLGHPGSPAQRQERSQKEQRPKACPKGSPGSPADQGRPPKDSDRGPSTDPKDPQPGFQEQPKAQQSEGTGRHEDSDLWPLPAWLQSPP
uniref:endonuclease V isoform X4 n=1 Tax=Myodes glareolus TaxID=447135 RepID=UPI00202093F9|nr:endonuclease V isoform X4 [Myodes glareolus]